MTTLAARYALSLIWPLLYQALTRPLTKDEITELRRLCDVLTQKLAGREEFNSRAHAFCLSLHASTLLGQAEEVDDLLHEVDELRRMLAEFTEAL